MPCNWEGNRRSGVALAMRHRQLPPTGGTTITIGTGGITYLEREMSTPPIPSRSVSQFTFYT